MGSLHILGESTGLGSDGASGRARCSEGREHGVDINLFCSKIYKLDVVELLEKFD